MISTSKVDFLNFLLQAFRLSIAILVSWGNMAPITILLMTKESRDILAIIIRNFFKAGEGRQSLEDALMAHRSGH